MGPSPASGRRQKSSWGRKGPAGGLPVEKPENTRRATSRKRKRKKKHSKLKRTWNKYGKGGRNLKRIIIKEGFKKGARAKRRKKRKWKRMNWV